MHWDRSGQQIRPDIKVCQVIQVAELRGNRPGEAVFRKPESLQVS